MLCMGPFLSPWGEESQMRVAMLRGCYYIRVVLKAQVLP